MSLEDLSDINKIKDMRTRKLFPGQSGRIGGFTELPDAGYPLYKVNNPNEAKFITGIRSKRKEETEIEKKGIKHLDKKLFKVEDRFEKRRLYSGDKLGLLSQLDLLDEDDLKRIKGKLKREK